MKHWAKDKYDYKSYVNYNLIADGNMPQVDASVSTHNDGTVYVGMTPLGDSTTFLTLEELKELVTILEAHEA